MPHESFSQTIKRIVPKPVNMDRRLKSLRDDPVSEEFVKRVEGQIAGRLRRTRRRI